MLNSLFRGTCAAALISAGQMAVAADWSLDAGSSKLAFGSIKKDTVGEVHSFESLTGTVDSAGTVRVAISYAVFCLKKKIHNDRMIAHVFKGTELA
ncbi:MAG: cytochrome C, partial [Ruegeria sp.]